MKIIGMKQLRQKFEPIRKGLEGGEEYLLMYRSKPLAILRPYQAVKDAEHLQRPGINNGTSDGTPTVEASAQTQPVPTLTPTSASKPLNRLKIRRAFV